MLTEAHSAEKIGGGERDLEQSQGTEYVHFVSTYRTGGTFFSEEGIDQGTVAGVAGIPTRLVRREGGREGRGREGGLETDIILLQRLMYLHTSRVDGLGQEGTEPVH